MTKDSSGYVTGLKLVILMTSITLAAFLMLLDTAIVVIAIPRITTEFHSLQDIGWYGISYNLASAALLPMSGKLYTYFKLKWTFLVFLVLLEIGSLICGVATSSNMLIIGRAITGFGSSGIQNGAFTIIAASVYPEWRPVLTGIVMGGAQLGQVVGPLAGGILTESTTWRWCFFINLPFGGFCAVLLSLVHIPDRRFRIDDSALTIVTSKLDLTGFFIFAPCTIMFLLALQCGGVDFPWDSVTIIGLFCGSGVTLLIFMYWENRAGYSAMIPFPVIRQREVWMSCLVILFLFSTVFVTSFYFPIYFQSVKGVSPLMSGVAILPIILSQLAFAVISGVLAQKSGYYMPFAVISAVMLTVGNGLLSTLGPHTPTAKWAGYQIMVGSARGMGMQMPIIAVQSNTATEITSIAIAMLVFSQTFGGAITITIADIIFKNKVKAELMERLPHSDADSIINAGATAIRHIVSEENVSSVVAAYAKSVNVTFYLAIAASGAMFLTSWGIGWKDIRKKTSLEESHVA
ncbi:hypothetical protein FOPG_18996 [Fusarium oxysporum f. sp. conglutinans race 2 54008]|uniref:Major facilitator superfamily (MFS) profile domain-containing protein n=1 Tax=Fusarium oxysporum f. sp. conglutinans race 2 54008 TaxID=1089457 RepID=X0GXY8_FUSOX|nr:hypothetical protein FOPG_18996 [Fusarium oxysporum f. sp. conglutinans race 2 54008]